MPRHAPSLDYMRQVVAFADAHGLDLAEIQFRITRRTISNYRRTLAEEDGPVDLGMRDQVIAAHDKYVGPALGRMTTHLEEVALKTTDLEEVRKAYESMVSIHLAMRTLFKF